MDKLMPGCQFHFHLKRTKKKKRNKEMGIQIPDTA